jgi:hypothetical protein
MRVKAHSSTARGKKSDVACPNRISNTLQGGNLYTHTITLRNGTDSFQSQVMECGWKDKSEGQVNMHEIKNVTVTTDL